MSLVPDGDDVYLAVVRKVLERRGYPRSSVDDLAPVWASRAAVRMVIDAAREDLLRDLANERRAHEDYKFLYRRTMLQLDDAKITLNKLWAEKRIREASDVSGSG